MPPPFEQQVLGRVADNRQFWEDHEASGLVFGAVDSICDERGVAGDISDGRVDLGQGDAHVCFGLMLGFDIFDKILEAAVHGSLLSGFRTDQGAGPYQPQRDQQ